MPFHIYNMLHMEAAFSWVHPSCTWLKFFFEFYLNFLSWKQTEKQIWMDYFDDKVKFWLASYEGTMASVYFDLNSEGKCPVGCRRSKWLLSLYASGTPVFYWEKIRAKIVYQFAFQSVHISCFVYKILNIIKNEVCPTIEYLVWR